MYDSAILMKMLPIIESFFNKSKNFGFKICPLMTLCHQSCYKKYFKKISAGDLLYTFYYHISKWGIKFSIWMWSKGASIEMCNVNIAEILLSWGLKFQFLIVLHYIISLIIHWSWFLKENKTTVPRVLTSFFQLYLNFICVLW